MPQQKRCHIMETSQPIKQEILLVIIITPVRLKMSPDFHLNECLESGTLKKSYT